MTISIPNLFSKHQIPFEYIGNNPFTICPFTPHKDGMGRFMLTFEVNLNTGRGTCSFCNASAEFDEIRRLMKIPEDVPPPDEKNRTFEQISPRVPSGPAEKTPVPEKVEKIIDVSGFQPMSAETLLNTLGLTIKRDEENKLIAFLCELSAFTENSQLNVSFNAPSSTGKSYIPTEVARLFPPEDVIEVGYCSPTAFFHDIGKYEKEKDGYTVDLSRKVLIFLDQPHTMLLQHLRPLLSHDKKELHLKITDKSQKAGIRTKNIFLRGFPAVIFCTAGLKLDEQESTRFILLSPETNAEKIRQAIYEKIRKESNSETYGFMLSENTERQHLKERIRAIRQAKVYDVRISNSKKIEEIFFSKNKTLKPRHQRDIGRILSLIKAFALLNLWFRDKDEGSIVANDADIDDAFKVWNAISESQEFNLPPYIYELYKQVMVPAWQAKADDEFGGGETPGLSRKEITRKHLEIYGRVLPDWLLRQQIIPMLENAGLLEQEPDPSDKRRILVYPTTPLTISPKDSSAPLPETYSESDGVVTDSEENIPSLP